MEFSDIVKKVDQIDEEKNYWFVRTDNGKYFQNYVDEGFIAIGWNYMTIDDLNAIEPLAENFVLKEKIAIKENLDFSNSVDKGKVTSIFNKLIAFKDLKKGDVVIIPSESSYNLAFGVIVDDIIYTDINDSSCEFHKRRKVKWVENKSMSDLDPMFYLIKLSRHTISSVNRYEPYIDRVMKSLFVKNGVSHYVMDIKTQDDINFNTLLELINNISYLTKELNDEFNLGENLDENSISLNLQSPGKIEFKFINGKSLILLATLLGPLGIGGGINNVSQEEIQELQDFKAVHIEKVIEIENAIDELEVDMDKIMDIY